MKKRMLTFFFLPVLCVAAFAQFKPNGTYTGLEKMDNYSDPAKPKYKWFHLSVLVFRDDSVFLSQSPVAIFKRDTVFSASGGGFYYYTGTMKNRTEKM